MRLKCVWLVPVVPPRLGLFGEGYDASNALARALQESLSGGGPALSGRSYSEALLVPFVALSVSSPSVGGLALGELHPGSATPLDDNGAWSSVP